MEIGKRKADNTLVVSLKGKLDAMTAPEFDKEFHQWLAADETMFVIDFKGLDYISSAGLRSILSSAKQVKARNGKLLLAGLAGPVKEVFELSGFYSVFQIFDSEEAAIKQM